MAITLWEVRIKTPIDIPIVLMGLNSPSRANTHSHEENDMAKRKLRVKRAGDGASARMLDTFHRIWLAGLGAAAKAQRGAPQLMEDLVEEGARVHAQTRGAAEKALRDLLGNTKATLDARVRHVKGQANDALDNLEKIFQTRVHRVLTQLGVPSAEEVETLSARVTALNESVKKLDRNRKSPRQRPGNSRKTAHSAAAPAP
jgi:poly(hydroxyalkanoate) granule-associated protein